MRENKGKGMCRRQKIEWILHQGQYKCANCGNGSPLPNVSHWRHGAPKIRYGWHTWSIHAGRHGRWDNAYEARREMAELLTKLDPKLYRKYMTNKRGRTVLYVELNKSLYGTLQAELLFWRNLASSLHDWGFDINPYDWWVANKTVDGKQMTVVWHVDDLKISNENGDTVDALINKPSERYGK